MEESSSLHSVKIMHGRKLFNRIFTSIYAFAIITLFYRHMNILTVTPVHGPAIFMAISDFILAFMWLTSQSFFMNPITRQQFPENLKQSIDNDDFPEIDVFICTADPFKEPPLTTVNTVLSVLGYDYPTEKLSVYVSDDGGSKLILFALMEAAKFAKYWLAYCRENKIEMTCPEEYFRRNHSTTSQFQIIQNLYESMKMKIENVVDRGEVLDECITDPQQCEAFSKWTKGFTPKDHPAIIQVLLESDNDKDVTGYSIPNLIYVSREKSTTSLHHFKAGALNALVSDPWFFLYVFLFFGAYAHDFVQFILFKGTPKRWWNDQRMWYVKALSPFLFASIEYLTKKLGITTKGFNVTSKVARQDERKMYDQSVFTFGIPSPMFVPLATTSIINLLAFIRGIMTVIFSMESLDEFFIQIFIAGFAVVNCLPVYEAMILRSDHGKMPKSIVITSSVLAGVLCIVFSLIVS